MSEAIVVYEVEGEGAIDRYIREPLVQKMREKLISDEGKVKYFMRQYIIKPIFGHLKFNVGYRNFLLRGLEKVNAEFKLMCIGWNVKKMLKMGIQLATEF